MIRNDKYIFGKAFYKKRPSQDECFDFCKKILDKYSITFDADTILSGARKNEIVFVRSLIAFILRKNGLSLPYIGKTMNRTHAAIINLLNYDRTEKVSGDNSLVRNSVKRWKKTTLLISKGFITEEFLLAEISYHEKRIKELTKQIEALKKYQ